MPIQQKHVVLDIILVITNQQSMEIEHVIAIKEISNHGKLKAYKY